MDWKARKLHFVGIGGAGMSGLALIAHGRGAAVSGSDRADSSYLRRLLDAGVNARLGHDPDLVPDDAEVVRSSAVPEDNSELQRAVDRGQPILRRGEFLAEICSEKRLIAVAGTHGKTTTAGMIAHCLRAVGADPAFVLGGELPLTGPGGGVRVNAAWGEGEWIVAEADESDASFLGLDAEVCVVTNVELEHHAHWGSIAALREAFAAFVAPARGAAVWARADLAELRPREGRLLRFGMAEDPEDGEPERAADRFELRPDGGVGFWLRGVAGEELLVELTVPGRHNVLNALAALAALELAGHEPAAVAGALRSFPGMARRFEFKGSRDGVLIYDDYAHHPTEVRATLEAARQLDPARLVAIFQPHLYSRTKELAQEFGAALSVADVIAVLDVYPAREEPVGDLAGVSGRMVAEAAADASGGRQVWWLPDADQALGALSGEIRDGDLVVTLGAGDIDALAERLSGDSK